MPAGPTNLQRGLLPLVEFRREVLTCNRCFASPRGCWHHEDVVGGYHRGKIVVIGVNPQATPGDRVYETIRDSAWQTKAALSDRILAIAAGRTSFADVDPSWQWMAGRHRGVSEWFPRVAKQLDVSLESLAEHFLFLEAFKHATRDQAALASTPEWQAIQARCPAWLHEQLIRLQPRLLILCGSPGRDTVAPLVLAGDPLRRIQGLSVAKLHGVRSTARVGEREVPVLFTYAVSGQTVGRWNRHDATDLIRRTVREFLSEPQDASLRASKPSARRGHIDKNAIRTPRQLLRRIKRLSPTSPLTDSFRAKWERLVKKRGGQFERKDVWYANQHEHWIGWLSEWDGPGAYGRKNWNRTAQFVYEHVVNPQMLVYLAEASGVPRARLRRGIAQALGGPLRMPSMCAALRRVIPWTLVEVALLRA